MSRYDSSVRSTLEQDFGDKLKKKKSNTYKTYYEINFLFSDRVILYMSSTSCVGIARRVGTDKTPTAARASVISIVRDGFSIPSRERGDVVTGICSLKMCSLGYSWTLWRRRPNREPPPLPARNNFTLFVALWRRERVIITNCYACLYDEKTARCGRERFFV